MLEASFGSLILDNQGIMETCSYFSFDLVVLTC